MDFAPLPGSGTATVPPTASPSPAKTANLVTNYRISDSFGVLLDDVKVEDATMPVAEFPIVALSLGIVVTVLFVLFTLKTRHE